MHGSNPIALAGGEGKKRSRGRHTTWPLDPGNSPNQLSSTVEAACRIIRSDDSDSSNFGRYPGQELNLLRQERLFPTEQGIDSLDKKLNERMVIWHTPVDQYHYKKSLLLDKVNRNSYITNTLYVRVWTVECTPTAGAGLSAEEQK